jgi:DnaJ-class molecular chaperone
MALKLHPDKNKAPSAQAAFRLISKAYDTLSNADKKAHYDRFGEEPDNGPQFRGGHVHQDFDPTVIFSFRIFSICFSMALLQDTTEAFFSTNLITILDKTLDNNDLEEIIKEHNNNPGNTGFNSMGVPSFI